LTVTFAIERAFSLRRRRVLPPSFARDLRRLLARRPLDPDAILKYCTEHPSPAARLFRTAVKRIQRPLPEVEKAIEDAGAKEARLLRRNTRVLFGVASVAPLLGLLGTVLGMISAFRDISGGEALGKADVLASGIYEALVTTAAGLTVAIPSLVLGLLFNAKIEKLVVRLDDLALEFVDALVEPETRKPRIA
jgi:biopolymer transport protein ExbB